MIFCRQHLELSRTLAYNQPPLHRVGNIAEAELRILQTRVHRAVTKLPLAVVDCTNRYGKAGNFVAHEYI